MSGAVEIFEVGPRDGLQNESQILSVEQKTALVDLLSRAGFRRIEVASFVSPKWVPQMATSGEVMAQIARAPGVSYAGLVPNMKGFAAARAAQVDEIAVFASASEGFSKANLNASISESLARFEPVMEAAKAVGLPVRGYVSCVVDCPFDGPTPPENVARVVTALREMGCYDVSLGDTIGKGRPEAVDMMLQAVLAVAEPDDLAGHFHDTRGRALENVDVALARGLRVFDAAVGGLGGCPYAPGAAGNLATERLLSHLTQLGYETGLDADVIAEAAEFAQEMRNV